MGQLGRTVPRECVAEITEDYGTGEFGAEELGALSGEVPDLGLRSWVH